MTASGPAAPQSDPWPPVRPRQLPLAVGDLRVPGPPRLRVLMLLLLLLLLLLFHVSMGRVLVLGSLRRAFKFVHDADTSGTGESRCGRGTGPRTAACVHQNSHDLIESLERRRLHRYITSSTALPGEIHDAPFRC